MKAFLKFGMGDALGRADEAGAELHADRAHLQIAGDQPAMADAAGDEDRHLGGERRQYLLGEHRGRDRADMAARLHPLDHQRVDARADQLLRQRQRRARSRSASRHYALIRSIEPDGGSPPARTTWLTSMARADVDQLGQHRMHGDEVDAERLRSVRFFVSAISVSSRSGVIAPQAITPKAPALDRAETRLRSEIQLIAPPSTATSQPRKSVPRFIRRARRSWPRWLAHC